MREVAKPQDLGKAIAKWEADRRIFQAAAGWDLSLNDQQFALLKMCPREIRREILKEFKADAVTGVHNFPNYISLKQRIMQIAHREIQETRKPLYNMNEAWSGSAAADEAQKLGFERAEEQDKIPEALANLWVQCGGSIDALRKGLGKGGKTGGGKQGGGNAQAACPCKSQLPTEFYGVC